MGAPIIPDTMRAVVIKDPGGEDILKVSTVAVPQPRPGQVLVKVHATTVITSELASREGVSTAKLPLVLGNDFIGTVVAAPGAEERIGSRILGAYGGYGYTRDGAWADYIIVDSADAFPIDSTLPSTALVAIAGSFTTASGTIHALGEMNGKTLLIRGGTSGVGLAIATLAIAQGATVISTTRNPDKIKGLQDHGVHHVVLDDGNLENAVRSYAHEGVDLAVEMLGVGGLSESIKCVRPFGIACLTGLLNDQATSIKEKLREDRSVPGYPHPMELIPPTVRLTIGGVVATPRTTAMVQDWVTGFEQGKYKMPIDSTYTLEDIASAHRRRADPSSFGKIVIRVSDPID
ncbi:hypothetical protein A1O1_03273 [Capronia coronata CBS 617.96]|uniref:Enoyl reductase (ER) domain-containing protein n=1 Tax=Capronia coronata CBS 617.96 TaxID=1182541 RepID=W9ZK63_9EURO|nr:uncharacterized protein A1O1_03273 [Capronia coronata CBS 617.96]EXJ94874.1 hypothetical protein A1O1_03273 [Capronia coronata CBS 617.96]